MLSSSGDPHVIKLRKASGIMNTTQDFRDVILWHSSNSRHIPLRKLTTRELNNDFNHYRPDSDWHDFQRWTGLDKSDGRPYNFFSGLREVFYRIFRNQETPFCLGTTSTGLVWPCLAMPCHALSCLAWLRAWSFFVKYQKWDSYCGVVLMSIFSLLTIWSITIDNNVGKI